MTNTTYKTSLLPNSRNVTRTELDNGISILVYENHNVESVVINGSIRAGSIYENPSQNGVASMVASSLMRGTQQRDFDQIHSELEDIGADLLYSTGIFKTGFNAKALAEDMPVLLEILADTLRNPVFPEDQVERLRGEQLTWLHYQQQDTRWQSGRAFREALYPTHHPFHYSARGAIDTIPGLTLDEMRTFHQGVYGPEGMILVIVGKVNAIDVLNSVRQHLGDWQHDNQPEQPPLPEIDAPGSIQRSTVHIPGKTQSDIAIGTLGPSRFEADYRASVLVNSILGQFGMMGRIGDVVREREGMAYYAYSSLDGGYGPGAWRVSAGVNPLNVERAIELIREEIRRITHEFVSDDDLDDNKAYFTGRLPLQLETSEGVASTLHTIESYDLGLDYLVNYPDEINSLTREDLLEAARHYLDADKLVIAVAGPSEDEA